MSCGKPFGAICGSVEPSYVKLRILWFCKEHFSLLLLCKDIYIIKGVSFCRFGVELCSFYSFGSYVRNLVYDKIGYGNFCDMVMVAGVFTACA